jgi:hypothetical protein
VRTWREILPYPAAQSQNRHFFALHFDALSL